MIAHKELLARSITLHGVLAHKLADIYIRNNFTVCILIKSYRQLSNIKPQQNRNNIYYIHLAASL